MKLPEDKAERNKILALVGVVVLAVGYGAFVFGVSPFLQKRKDEGGRVEELRDKLWRARKDIQIMPRNIARNRDLIDHLLDVSEARRHILRPNLGNYLLVATDIIEQAADALGLEVDSIDETTPVGAHVSSHGEADPNGPRFKAYNVNVTLSCSLHDLVRFIRRLEEANPYLCITRLGVIARPATPEVHAASFDIEWPVWVENRHPVRLAAERLADEEPR